MLGKYIQDLYSDIAPLEGRGGLERWCIDTPAGKLKWADQGFCLGGELSGCPVGKELTLHLQAKIYPHPGLKPAPGWIELETGIQPQPVIADLHWAGSRPLPHPEINCICRHPLRKEFLVAGTRDAQLLLLDARLPSDLQVLAEVSLTAPLAALVCCGQSLLGLEAGSDPTLQIIEVVVEEDLPAFITGRRITLPLPLTALAENDAQSAWGLNKAGEIFLLQLPGVQVLPETGALVVGDTMRKIGTLGRSHVFSASLSGALKSIYRAVKARKSAWRKLCRRQGTYAGLAFDGRYFWGFRQSRREEQSSGLLLYNQQGQVMRAFTTWPEASISYLSYCHNRLLVLDLEKQQLHQYCLADTLQPIASLDTIKSHPGYLPGGTAASGGIHDLCLLYVGAEAKNSVHLYNVDKLRPLVGYVDPQGVVQDHFMDGFLLLAQYSPLLNGRTFSDDLKGPPSQREDWLALFDQYFHPQGNLTALEACTAAMRAQMGASHAEVIKVVLGIPSADQRCQDWDQQGLSLAGAMQRVEVTRWAMQALIDRWSRAGFKGLTLSGFYYMSEQGAWNDPLLKIFPGLCHEQGLRSFAIPGLTSSWLTEYSRVGFDCVALQSSHAFWKPWRRPAHYALVSAGRIAREFGMGMEVELPYNILEPAGQEKLRDYLHMAYIQGWAGAFKTYFHSYNLIKALAESENPAGRELYDELYRLSRISRRPEVESGPANHGAIIIDWQHAWINNSGVVSFRLNIEGYQGVFELHGLSVR